MSATSRIALARRAIAAIRPAAPSRSRLGLAAAVRRDGVLQQFGDQRGPARLMAGPEPLAGVAVKVLVEEHEIAPVRIVGETAVRAVTGHAGPFGSRRKSRISRAGQFAGHLAGDS